MDAVTTITVPGRGAVESAADIAGATFVVEATRPTAADARATAASAATAVLDALVGTGVARADLRTSGLDVQAAWDHETGRPIRRGFTVTHRIAATIRDLEAVGRVVDAGLGAGATGLDGVEFRIADADGPTREARALAVRDARARAETIAAATGGTLGRLRSIVEGGDPGGPGPLREMRMMAMAAADVETPVMPGRIEVSVRVVAEWTLE